MGLAMISQKFLKGVPQRRIDGVAEGIHQFTNFSKGLDYDFAKLTKFYTLLCENILSEQKRIGGDFAIAHAVLTREIRDHIRNILGTKLVFVVLHMSKEDQEARIKARHGDAKSFVERLVKMYDLFEPACEDESNTINCMITKDMTRDDVIEKIIQLVKQNS